MLLPSAKWNAKHLANNPHVKLFYALEAVTSILPFETENIQNLSEQESAEYLEKIAEELVNNPKPRNARILATSALKPNNISSHRYALISRILRHYQAIPIFEPKTLQPNESLNT